MNQCRKKNHTTEQKIKLNVPEVEEKIEKKPRRRSRKKWEETERVRENVKTKWLWKGTEMMIKKSSEREWTIKKGGRKDYLKLPVLPGLWCLWHSMGQHSRSKYIATTATAVVVVSTSTASISSLCHATVQSVTKYQITSHLYLPFFSCFLLSFSFRIDLNFLLTLTYISMHAKQCFLYALKFYATSFWKVANGKAKHIRHLVLHTIE